MDNRFTSVVCVDLLMKKNIDNETYILLMKRKNTGFNDGEYELPGGHLEANEDLYEAMIREANEELCINLRKENLNILYLMHHYTGDRLNFIFETDGNSLMPKIGEPNKCDEIIWVNINKLPNKTTDKVKIMINDIINNKNYNKLKLSTTIVDNFFFVNTYCLYLLLFFEQFPYFSTCYSYC